MTCSLGIISGSRFVNRSGFVGGSGSGLIGGSRCRCISRSGFVNHRFVGVFVGVSGDVVSTSHSGKKGEGEDLQGF